MIVQGKKYRNVLCLICNNMVIEYGGNYLQEKEAKYFNLKDGDFVCLNCQIEGIEKEIDLDDSEDELK